MHEEKLDFVALQETIRGLFSNRELEALGGNAEFKWEWVPAHGHSGGILLLGVNSLALELLQSEKGEFFVGAEVTHKSNGLRWFLMVVYGPADHRRSKVFLNEIHDKVLSSAISVVIGGNFNLIRDITNKSNLVVNNP